MKVSFVKTMFAKLAMTAAVSAMPFSLVVQAAAPAPADTESLSAFRVRFVGGDNEELIFSVKYHNKDRDSFKLLVLDETGDPLFEDNYSRDLDKKLSVPRLTDAEHVIFVVKCPRENTELSFKVKITTRVSDDADITAK